MRKTPAVTRFGQLMRLHRKRQKLTQANVAARMGYRRSSSVAVLERSHDLPTPETIILAARALQVPTSWLLRGVDDPYGPLRRDEVETGAKRGSKKVIGGTYVDDVRIDTYDIIEAIKEKIRAFTVEAHAELAALDRFASRRGKGHRRNDHRAA